MDYPSGCNSFLATPRCASRSICRALGEDHNHQPIWFPRHEGKVVFSVFRNPTTRTASWYYRHPEIKKLYGSFKNWVRLGCPTHWDSDQEAEPKRVIHQLSFMAGEYSSRLGLVVKYEDLDKTLDLPIVVGNTPENLKETPDDETVRMLKKLIPADYEAWHAFTDYQDPTDAIRRMAESFDADDYPRPEVEYGTGLVP